MQINLKPPFAQGQIDPIVTHAYSYSLHICIKGKEKMKQRENFFLLMFLIIKNLVTKVFFLYYIDVSKTFINHLKKLYNISNIDKTKISCYNGNR